LVDFWMPCKYGAIKAHRLPADQAAPVAVQRAVTG
jgi:hypothetical protein